MEKHQESFTYTYSAQQQEEIQNIRSKYLPPEEDKMERLRKLHHSATQKAQAVSLVLGIIGALVMGAGMSLIMTDLAKILGSYQDMAMVIGIPVGVVGGVLASLAYPIYNAIVKAKRKKLAPEIIRLTDELMK